VGYLITSFVSSPVITATVEVVPVTDTDGKARVLVEALDVGLATVTSEVTCGDNTGKALVTITPCDEPDDCGLCQKCVSNFCVYQEDSEDIKNECTDGEQCTTGDCNGLGACGIEPNGITCDDGDPSTDDETCQYGVCKAPSTPQPIPQPSCSVVISPSSATVESGDTAEFTAVTTCGGADVTGTHTWEITDDAGILSDINQDGQYTAGNNDTGSDITETIKVTDTSNNVTDTATVTVKTNEVPVCEVIISPDSVTVRSFETAQFEAQTICDGDVVEGTLQWEVTNTIGSSIDVTGLYTAGDNNTGSGVIDTIQVTDTDYGVSDTAEVTVRPQAPPPICDITLTPSISTIDSGKTVTFTAAIEGEGCLDPDFSWGIDSDPEVNSQIAPSGATCLYTSGNNETGMLLEDTITVSDSSNEISTDITIGVLYGRILNVFPKTLLGSRWLPLFKTLFIIGEDTAFASGAYPTFTPDDSIILCVKLWGKDNLMILMLLLSANPGEGLVDLAVTTTNGEGQTVVFPMEDAFDINLLPLMLDMNENKP